MTDAATVARGLTKAQRTMLVNAEELFGQYAGWVLYGDRRARSGLAAKGLCRDYLNPRTHLTSLGLAVRAILQQEQTK